MGRRLPEVAGALVGGAGGPLSSSSSTTLASRALLPVAEGAAAAGLDEPRAEMRREGSEATLLTCRPRRAEEDSGRADASSGGEKCF